MSEPTKILPVSVMPWGMVNAFVVYSERGCVLVDAGLPDSLPQFERALDSIERSLKDVRLIVVTHGHVDHAGCAALLREQSGAPIVAHEREQPFLEGTLPMTLCPTRPFGRFLLRLGAPLQPYRRFAPDIALRGDDSLSLGSYGIRGRIVPTPGHTPGSISVTLDGGTALVGDMVASGILLGGIAFKRSPARPPFEEDPAAVALQLERLVVEGNRQFYLGHGGPLGAREVERHVEKLRKLAS